MMQKHSAHVELALKTIQTYLSEHKIIKVPEDTPAELLNKQAGAFVSLHRHGELRGCIGTIEPTKNSLAEEIINNAVSAAVNDPRFPAMKLSEMEGLECSVDVLGEAEPIKDISELNPKVYGVIVESGYKRGLLLPDLEEVDTAEYQVDIAKRKAGIYPGEKVQLYRFKVDRFH